MNVLLLKPAIDTKGSDRIVSRLGADRKVDMLATPDINIFQAVKQWSKDVEPIDCVLADEAQFFTSDQIDQLLQITVELGIPVICYGIRTDFQTKLFTGSAI
jgi:thymidine kinase